MKVSVTAKDFKRMLKLAQSITDRYGIIEDRIAMSVHDGKFEIAAISFEGEAAFLYQWTNAGDVYNDDFEFVPAECGFCVVRHKGLAPLKGIDKSSDIVIEHTGNVVTFTADGAVFTVPAEDPGEWPVQEATETVGKPADTLEIIPDDCARFAYVALAASKDTTRLDFTGAVLRDGTLAATDSHRLHMRPLPALFGTGTFEGIIAPKLLRFIADGHAGKLTEFLDTTTRREKDKDVTKSFPTWHVLEGPDFVFKSKVIGGRFPDLRKVTPRYRDGEIGEIDAKTFAKTVKPLFAGWKHSIAIRLYNEQGGVRLVCTGKPNSKSPDQEPRLAFVKDLQLPNLPVAMNPAYVIDALTGVSGTVKFCAIDCDSPIWIGGFDCGECTSGSLIMPIQL